MIKTTFALIMSLSPAWAGAYNLTWDNPNPHEMASYNVYDAESGSKITTSSINEAFVNVVETGMFFVTAVNHLGLESEPSAFLVVKDEDVTEASGSFNILMFDEETGNKLNSEVFVPILYKRMFFRCSAENGNLTIQRSTDLEVWEDYVSFSSLHSLPQKIRIQLKQ